MENTRIRLSDMISIRITKKKVRPYRHGNEIENPKYYFIVKSR